MKEGPLELVSQEANDNVPGEWGWWGGVEGRERAREGKGMGMLLFLLYPQGLEQFLA